MRDLRSLAATSVLIVIPARYQSTRFPGKPLADLDGRPMIEHVYARASAARKADAVLVATDDSRIAEVVRGFGGEVMITGADHATGTDRLAEIARQVPSDILVNVQGDEPLIAPEAIDAAIEPLLADAAIPMSTLSRPIESGELDSQHVVKVVCDQEHFALYFSRAAIPGSRDPHRPHEDAARAHVGLYAYRRDTLLRLAGLPAGPLERIEQLEQLRALEHGIRIKVRETRTVSLGVDTPADLERVRELLRGKPGRSDRFRVSADEPPKPAVMGSTPMSTVRPAQ